MECDLTSLVPRFKALDSYASTLAVIAKENSDVNFADLKESLLAAKSSLFKNEKRRKRLDSIFEPYINKGKLIEDSKLGEDKMIPDKDFDQEPSRITTGLFLNSLFKGFPDSKQAFINKSELELAEVVLYKTVNNKRQFQSAAQINEAIQTFKRNKLKSLIDYVNQLPETIKGVKEFKAKTDNIDINSSTVDFIVSDIKQSLSDIFSIKGKAVLPFMPSYNQLSEGKVKDTIQAYCDYINLTYFDDVARFFFDFMSVDFNADKDNKYKINFGTNVKVSWADDADDDFDYSQELGAIPGKIVSMLPLINKNGDVKGKLSLQTFYNALSAIRKLQYDKNINNNTILNTIERVYENKDKELSNLFTETELDELKAKYNTLPKLIAGLKLKESSKVAPILFKVMDIIERSKNPLIQDDNLNNYIYSVHAGLFDMTKDNSLVRVWLNTPNRQNINYDYYSHVIQLLNSTDNLPISEIGRDEKNNVKHQDISENNKNDLRNQYIYSQQARLSILVDLATSLNIPGLTVEIGKDNNNTKTCQIKFTNTTDNKNSTITIDYDLSKPSKPTGDTTIDTAEIKQFVSKVLNIPTAAIEALPTNDQNNALYIACNMLFSNAASKAVLAEDPNATLSTFKTEKSTYFNEDSNTSVRVNGYLQYPPLTESKLLPYLDNLLSNKELLSGNPSTANVNKDLSKSQINSITLSQLMTKVRELHVLQNQLVDEDLDPTKQFSLFDLLKSTSSLRDAKGIDGTVKKATTFNFGEFFATNFLVNYMGDKNVKHFLACVISDKSKIPITEIDFTTKISDEYVALLNDPKITTDTKYIDLNNAQVKTVLKHELGNYYFKMAAEIKSTYDELSSGEYGKFNPFDNFADINSHFNNANVSNKVRKEYLHKAIYAAQQKNPKFRLTENSFYMWRKNKDTGFIELTLNPLLIQQLCMWNDKQTLNKTFGITDIESFLKPLNVSDIDSESFWKRKEAQVASDLLGENFSLNTRGKSDYGSQELNKRKDWMDGKNMVICKLNKGDKYSLDITSRSQFKYESTEYKTVQKAVRNGLYEDQLSWDVPGLNKFDPSTVDIDSPKFDFNTFVSILNLMSPIASKLNRIEKLKKIWVDQRIENGDDDISTTSLEQVSKAYKNKFGDDFNEENFKNKNKDDSEKAIRKYLAYNAVDAALSNAGETDYDGKSNADKQLDILYANIKVGTSTLGDTIKSIEDNTTLQDNKAKNEALNKALGTTNLYLFTNTDTYKFELHPDLKQYNTWDYLLGQEYLNATVGSYVNHPCKKFLKGGPVDVVYMSAQSNIAQVKRNVMEASPVHQLHSDCLNGAGFDIHVAVIDDLESEGYNFVGDHDEHAMTVTDGITYTNYLFNILENNSLESQAVGTDKKDFGTYYDPRSGLGFIMKTSGDALTNERILRSHRNFIVDNEGKLSYKEGPASILNRKMNDTIRWSSVINKYNQNPKLKEEQKQNTNLDWTKTYHGGKLNLKEVYVQLHGQFTEDGEQLYERRTNFGVDSEGKTYYDAYECYNDTENGKNTITDTGKSKQVVINSKINLENAINDGKIDSNYQLWKYVFGGEFSVHVLEDGKLGTISDYDNTSFDNLVEVANNIGFITEENRVIKSQADVFQVLKHSMIAYMPTAGAIKQGASNINTNEIFSDPNYDCTYMDVNLFNWGNQLNSEHHADDSLLSLMTQVVNALGARGYTQEEANIAYNTMYQLTKIQLQNVLSTDDEVSLNAVANIIINGLKNVTSADGDLMNAIFSNLEQTDLKSHGFDKLRGKFPISMFRNKIASLISSSLTKKGVKIKYNGSMCVLCPSDKQYLMFGNFTADYCLQHPQEVKEQQEKQKPLVSASLMQPDHNYILKDKKGNIIEHVKFTNPNAYWAIMQKAVSNGYNIVEDTTTGRDLSSYHCTFKCKIGDKEVIKSLWDLASVWNIWHDKTDLGTKKLAFQQELNAIGEKVASKVKIMVYDAKIGQMVEQEVEIVPDSTRVTPYELIAPKIFQSEFGLRQGDDLCDIQKQGWKFFYKRRVEQFNAQAINNNNVAYAYDLSTYKGNHYYLDYKAGYDTANLIKQGFHRVDIRTQQDKDGVYRVDNNDNKMYYIPKDIAIYSDGKHEIILSDREGIQQLLTKLKYNDIKVEVVSEEVKADLKAASENNTIVADYYNTFNIGELSDDNIKAFAIAQNEANVLNHLNGFADDIDEDSDKAKQELTPAVRYQIRKAKQTYNSFLESLKFIASRTPAQSYQSFMPMKIVAFTNSGLNSAYVSRWQIWLQGSDFDIDKASLLGKAFKDGHLVTWSRLQDMTRMSNFQQVMNLPFPTSEEYAIDANANNEITEEIIKGYIDPDFLDYTKSETIGEKAFEALLAKYGLNGGDDVKSCLKAAFNAGNMVRFKNFLADAEMLRHYKTDAIGTKSFNLVKELVDYHNLTFQKDKTDMADAAKNCIVYNIYRCSASPVNQIQAQTALDASVKMITDYISGDKGSQYTVLSAMNNYVDPGSATTKIKQLVLNLTGKDDVSKVASAMKIFECLSSYENTLAGEGDESLISSLNVAGVNVHLLANTHTFAALKDGTLKDALDNVDQKTDAFILFSVLLTLATDNAKNPVLAMINGGPEMIQYYTAGVMTGIPLDILIRTMLSKTGLAIRNLVSGNIILGKQGLGTATKALSYLQNGPQPSNFIQDIVKSYYGIDDTQLAQKLHSEYFLQNVVSILKDIVGDKPTQNPTDEKQKAKNERINKRHKENAINILLTQLYSDDEVRAYNKQKDKNKLDSTIKQNAEQKLEHIKEIKKALWDQEVNKDAQDDIEKAIKDYNAGLNNISKADLFQTSNSDQNQRKLDLAYNFMQEVKDYLYLKQDIEGEQVETIPAVDKEGNIQKDGGGHIIYQKYSALSIFQKLDNLTKELNSVNLVAKLNKGIPNKPDELIKVLNNLQTVYKQQLNRATNKDTIKKSDSYKKLIEANEGLGYEDKELISIKDFINNEDYRNTVIDAYEDIKTLVNVPKVWFRSDHYFGYLRATNAAYDKQLQISEVSDVVDILSKKLSKYPLSESNEILNRYMRLGNFVRYKQNQLFFAENPIEIKVDFTDNKELVNARKTNFDNYLNLNTYEGKDKPNKYDFALNTLQGRMNFKVWMDEVIFPYIQNHYTDNFARHLGMTTFNGNDDFSTTVNYNVDIETNPRVTEPSERTQFNKTLQAFDNYSAKSIKGITGDYTSLANLIYLYNIIAYKNSNIKGAFTNLTQDMLNADNDNLPKKYINFIAVQDATHTITDLVDDTMIEEALRYSAPKVSMWALNKVKYPYAWVKNDANKFVLVTTTKSDDTTNYDIDYGDDTQSNGYDDVSEFLDNDDDGSESNQGTQSTFSALLQNASFKLLDVNNFMQKAGGVYEFNDVSNLKNAPQKFTSSNNKTYWFKKSTLGTYNLTYGITSLQKLNYENGKFELTNKEPTQLQKDLLAAITYTNGTYRIDADAIDKTIEESKKQNQNKCK